MNTRGLESQSSHSYQVIPSILHNTEKDDPLTRNQLPKTEEFHLRSSVVALRCKHPKKENQYRRGSGIMLSSDLVLTSAHNIVRHSKQQTYQFQKADYQIFEEADGVGQAREVEDWRYLQDYKTSHANDRLQYDFALIKLKPNKKSTTSKYTQLSLPCGCFLNKKADIKLEVQGYSIVKKESQQTFQKFSLTLPSNSFNVYPKDLMLTYEGRCLKKIRGCPIMAGNYIIAIFISSQELQNTGRLVSEDMLGPLMAWTKQLKGDPISIKAHPLCKPFRGIYNSAKGTIEDAQTFKLNGDKFRKEYKYQLSLQSYTKSMKIYEYLTGKSSYEVAEVLVNGTGDVYQMKGQFVEALEHLKHGMEIYQQTEGEQSYNTAIVLGRIGWVYNLKGQYQIALDSHNRAMTIMIKLRGKNSVEVADLHSKIGLVYKNMAAYDLSLDHYQQSLSIYERTKDKYKVPISELLNAIGEIYDMKCQDQSALKYFSNALKIKESLSNYNCIETVNVLMNNGIALYNLGKFVRAIAMYNKCIWLLQTIGLKSRRYADAHHNSGLAYDQIQDFRSSLEVSKIALPIYQSLSLDNQARLSCILLANSLKKIGEEEELREIMEKYSLAQTDLQ